MDAESPLTAALELALEDFRASLEWDRFKDYPLKHLSLADLAIALAPLLSRRIRPNE